MSFRLRDWSRKRSTMPPADTVLVECAECGGSGMCRACGGAGTDPACPCRLYAHVPIGGAKYGYFIGTIATPGACVHCHGRGRLVRRSAVVMASAAETT